MNVQEYNHWVMWQVQSQFYKKLPNYFPDWLKPFTAPAAVYERTLSVHPRQHLALLLFFGAALLMLILIDK